jgi:penicillin-binding protein 2
MRGIAEGGRIPPTRLWLTYVVMAVIFLVFVSQLVRLQIQQGSTYLGYATENRITDVHIPAPRGVIYDRNGSILVRNVPAFNIMVTPALLPDSQAEVDAIFKRLSELSGVPVNLEGPKAARCVAGRGIKQLVDERASIAPYEAWPVACNVDELVARTLGEQQVDMPGVSIEAEPVRDYVTGALTSDIIGYLGPIPASLQQKYEQLNFVIDRDKIGYAGIEATFQDILAGSNGLKHVEEDVAGQPLREVGDLVQPTPGNSLKLTIDTRLQAVAASALQNRMDFINRYAGEVRTPMGVVIVINPQTGEILAMVSLPTYENNRLARFIPLDYYQQLVADDRGKPLINHAISLTFAPGSTFKLSTAIGVLNENVISPTQKIMDPGKITIKNAYFPNDPGQARDFVCWKADGHGMIDFVHAIAFSCNIYFYKVGGGFDGDPIAPGGLGIDRIGEYARAIGYGSPLGIELPAEVAGLIPDKTWKRIQLGESWSTGDTYNTATGQGFVGATPLQVLESAVTMANGGKVMWPHLVQEVLDGEGNVIKRVQPCVLWNIADGVKTPPDQIGSCIDAPQTIKDNAARTLAVDVNVDPKVIDLVRQGMHLVVTEGTASQYAQLDNISSAGKTGTGEFCDTLANSRGLCIPGQWPSHAWYVAFAPYENPEVAAVAFVYNGTEGAVTSAPIVKQVLDAYFSLKAIDAAKQP